MIHKEATVTKCSNGYHITYERRRDDDSFDITQSVYMDDQELFTGLYEFFNQRSAHITVEKI